MPSRAEAAWAELRAASGPAPRAGAGAGTAALLALQTRISKTPKGNAPSSRPLGRAAAGAGAAGGAGRAKAAAGPSLDAAALRAAASAALQAAAGADGSSKDAKRTVTKTFAGEQVEVVESGLCGRDKVKDKGKAAAAGAGGLDAVLSGVIEKKEGGVTTMTKTRSDWAQAKAAGGAAMEEELEAHKKSGSTYLDKQEFLKKAEWKEYEQTREAKLRAEGVSR